MLDAAPGRIIRKKFNEPVHMKTTAVVPNEGMPKRKGGGKGDLIITFEIQYPSKLTDEQKKTIRGALES